MAQDASRIRASTPSGNREEVTATILAEAIRSMYIPGRDPSAISSLDADLRRVQRTPEAWKLSDELLDNEDERVQFFGALTLTVKINNDWSELTENDIESLLHQLLLRLMQAVNESKGSLVIRKLCSALVALFLRQHVSWTSCLRTLVTSFREGRVVLEKDIDYTVGLDILLDTITVEQTACLMWFSQILAEEVSKHDTRRLISGGVLDRITPNVIDITDMLQRCLSRTIHDDLSHQREPIERETLHTLQAWIKLSHQTWITEDTYSKPLSALIPLVIRCIPIPSLTKAATDVIGDIVKDWSRLIDESAHRSILEIFLGPFGRRQISILRSGDFEEDAMAFASLLFDYVDMQANRFGRQGFEFTPFQKYVSVELLECCHELLQCQGVPIIEDEVCTLAVTVWINIVGLLDEVPEPPGLTWLQEMRHHVIRTIHECIRKLRLPPRDVVSKWDQDEIENFAMFRRETSELFELAFWYFQGPQANELFDILVPHLTSLSMSNSDWEGLEVSVYCLNAIADYVVKIDRHDNALEAFVAQGLFSQLVNLEDRLSIPAYKTFVRWVGEYASFFKRRPQLLPSALQFLFNMLTSVAIADATAKAISQLCDSCRERLVAHLDELVGTFEKLRVLSTANSYVKEKLIKAISTIGQALDGNEAKAKYLEYIISQFEDGARAAHGLFLRNQVEESLAVALEVLRSLKIVAKAFQEPSSDLDDVQEKDDFWSQGPGQSIQNRILDILQLPFVIKNRGPNIDLLETACGTINGGLTEKSGPFRLTSQKIADYICQCNGPDSLCTALPTAIALISAQSSCISPRIVIDITRIYLHSAAILLQVLPSQEPDLFHEAFNFFDSMTQNHMDIIFETVMPHGTQGSVLLINAVTPILLSTLTIDDPRPKRASAALWSKFLNPPNLSRPAPANLNSWMLQAGPELTGYLVWNFAGSGPRSHIEFLAPVFCRLVFTYAMHIKGWIENAFQSDLYWPRNAKASEDERGLWCAKVVKLRGRRKETRELVEELWLQCRGTAFRYT